MVFLFSYIYIRSKSDIKISFRTDLNDMENFGKVSHPINYFGEVVSFSAKCRAPHKTFLLDNSVKSEIYLAQKC